MTLWDEEFANLCKLRFASGGEINRERQRKSCQSCPRNLYMNDFLKSDRTAQEAIEICQKVQNLLSKGRFNLTKCITSDEEFKSQIPEAEISTKNVKTFDAKPQSSPILGLKRNLDTESLRVCCGTQQEVPAKITQRIVLSFVSVVFDPFGICSLFKIRIRFLLKRFWAAMGQASATKLSAEQYKLFSDWCSELREIRTMSINGLISKTDVRTQEFTSSQMLQ